MSTTLKLQVLLGAVDKLTAPLKAVTGQSRITATELAKTKATLRDLEKQSGQIEGYRTLGKQIGITRAQLSQAQETAQRLARELANTANPTSAMTRQFDKAKAAVRDLTTKEREMVSRHGTLHHALRSAGIDTGQLSQHQRKLKTDMANATTELNRQRAALEKMGERQRKLAAVRTTYQKTKDLQGKLGGNGAAMLASGTAMGMTTLKPVIEFAKAEGAVTDLRVSMMGQGGTVRQEFQAISDLATSLGNKLPGTTADFQTMMSTLIQQGMSSKAILGGLGEATAYLGVQLKLPYDQAALFAAKLQDATGTAEKDMMGLMDVIQRAYYLGVDSDNMLGAYSKLTPALGVLKKAGLDAAKTLAPLIVQADQAAMNGEAAGNAFRKVFQLSMNTKKISKATKGTGLSLNFTDGKGEFAGLENMYAQLDKLKGLTTEKRLAVLKDIYGDDAETLQALEIMINKGLAGYRETQKKMADQAALQERVNAQLGTLGNLWDAATGTFTNAMVNFGEAIAPEVKALTEWIGSISERLGDWSKRNPELSNTIMKVGAVVSGLAIVVGGLSLGVAAVLGPMALMRVSMAVLGINTPLLGAAFSMLVKPLQMMGGAFLWAGRMMLTTPLGWILTAVAAIAYGAYLIYQKWDRIGPWFKSLWEGCKATMGAFCAYLGTLPSQALEQGKAIVGGLIDGIMAKWNDLMTTVKGLTSYLPDWLKGGQIDVKANPVMATATGSAGYQTPLGASGYGPALYQPPSLKPAASRTVVNQPSYQIAVTPTPGMDEERLARKTMALIKEHERSKQRQGRASYNDNH